mmetsp:Transcript_27179/g.90370  ORF Transcript_27179/g.90370 Transcript_27179/m.90370 type:complete len:282 (-) Transcript_27179:634-1479(-)
MPQRTSHGILLRSRCARVCTARCRGSDHKLQLALPDLHEAKPHRRLLGQDRDRYPSDLGQQCLQPAQPRQPLTLRLEVAIEPEVARAGHATKYTEGLTAQVKLHVRCEPIQRRTDLWPPRLPRLSERKLPLRRTRGHRPRPLRALGATDLNEVLHGDAAREGPPPTGRQPPGGEVRVLDGRPGRQGRQRLVTALRQANLLGELHGCRDLGQPLQQALGRQEPGAMLQAVAREPSSREVLAGGPLAEVSDRILAGGQDLLHIRQGLLALRRTTSNLLQSTQE